VTVVWLGLFDDTDLILVVIAIMVLVLDSNGALFIRMIAHGVSLSLSLSLSLENG
jgi:hypothetical protein